MIDKFEIFNNINIDTDKYVEVDTCENEDLKIAIKERLKLSKRMNKKRNKAKVLISSAASVAIVVLGIGVLNPSLAENIIKKLPQFQTMLDKIRESIYEEPVIEYDPNIYPEREEEKKENQKNKLTATPINVSSKSNSLEITIDKAMYDKKKIYLGMTLKTDERFKTSEFIEAVYDSPYGDGEKNMYIEDLVMYINGNRLDNYGWSAGVVEFIDEYTINLDYLIELDPTNNIDDANFKITFGIPKYEHPNVLGSIEGQWSFDFNIKATDDNSKNIDVNKKDGDYTLKSVKISKTYVETRMELPFQPSLGNAHNNFIILRDDKGRELELTTGKDQEDKMYTQINELINIGEIPKYIDISIYESYPIEGKTSKALSSFRVDLE